MGRVGRHKKVKAIDPLHPKAAKLAGKAAVRLPEAPPAGLEERMPRGLQLIMQSKERVASAQKKSRESSSSSTLSKAESKKGTTHDELPTMQAGESVHSYHKRVDAAAAQLLKRRLNANKAPVSERRKEFLHQRKMKQKGKDKAKQEDMEQERREHQRETIRFGEVAQDVPHFTAKPRLKKRPAAPKSASPEVKLFEAAEKRILEAERTRVIAVYRQMKLAEKLRAGGGGEAAPSHRPVPLSSDVYDDDDDDDG